MAMLIIVLSGCGGGNDNRTELTIDDLALDAVNLYLKFHDLGDQSKEDAINFIHEHRESLSNPTKFDELANLLDKNDLVKAEEVYNELGGKPIK
ncbi:hypothetical protein [Paenibacillus sp. J23TS9]|uniref:hypothetical protein n=1 Tax=Paenibacillus sp. J23TS9 TaxID=2807193 RepID=UPI001BCE488B|nr:hypothetical protein [Paenibacillus sp. J23TS9]